MARWVWKEFRKLEVRQPLCASALGALGAQRKEAVAGGGGFWRGEGGHDDVGIRAVELAGEPVLRGGGEGLGAAAAESEADEGVQGAGFHGGIFSSGGGGMGVKCRHGRLVAGSHA